MKQSRINVFASIALAAILASCAGLNKMKSKAEDVTYTVTPEVLEAHAGRVDVTVKVKVPENYMDKKATVELTPVLKYEGGETAFDSKTVQGEKAEGNNQVISYLNGGQYTYTGSVPYNENMKVSDLVVRIKATKSGQSMEFDDVKIAEGVIATAGLVEDKGAAVALGKDNFQRVIPESKDADIYFLIQQAALRGTELRKEEIKALKDYIKEAKAAENKEFKGVSISAYASPDGPTDLNTTLSEKRQKAAKGYLAKELRRAKVDESAEDFFDLKNTPEDWEGFKALMETSSIQDKELILRVLSMYSDPEVREKEIKNMSETYKVIKDDILPQLRRSKVAVNVEVIGKSDEEISELASSNPSELNVEEILYAATLTEGLDAKLDIYKKAAKQFPKCWRAQNDIAYILVMQDKLDDAKSALDKANELSPNNAIVNNNLGVVALRQGDLAKAEEYFGAAAGAGPELDNNLGIVSIHKGDYDAAMRYFGNSTSTNAALAKILAGKYDAALSTLNANTQEVGFKYYLKAIVGARTADNDMVFDSLRKAVELDASLKADAAKDKEFAKFMEDASFKAIIQ
ncbi:tetratricopeptide repeat protein [Saccharicrinis fermentans]|uniref:Flp pilus assembly protein TadD n=1 Tax=Saccharicrinis fermentans DSM 9555 = JCM 21142 TaxID=869213 RepID=W7Y8G4_9BACT|nr:tetratricopeptide repeat protein [Saccharicrinis fermentans]GAF03978.1 Flp pilus assembly protein TadD [Saccharicrinis fermentans DSM 9555 = JCM 21142]